MFTFIFGVFSRSISTKQHTFFSLSAPKDTEKMTHSMLVSGGVGCVSVIVESKENFFCLMLDVTYQIMNTQYFAQFNLNINLQACASFSLLLILLASDYFMLLQTCSFCPHTGHGAPWVRVLSSLTRSFILAFFTDISSAQIADSQIFTADWKRFWK